MLAIDLCGREIDSAVCTERSERSGAKERPSTCRHKTMNGNTTSADGGQERNDQPDVNGDAAERYARKYLADRLAPDGHSSSDLCRAYVHACNVSTALERGDVPELKDIKIAREHLRQCQRRLDEVAELFDIHRYETGVEWGDLTDDERAEIEARDCGRDS